MQKRWLAAHKNTNISNSQDLQLEKNLQFARDLFESWDKSGDGTINEDEAVRPLVSLGLVPDHKFARKIW